MSKPNQEKMNAFSNHMLDILNGSMLGLMVGIGYKTGLFEVMAGLPPSTSKQIASASGSNERYVREWLAAMTTGRIIDYDPENNAYSLPPEHASLLTQTAGADNMARLAMVIPSLASVQEEIIDCFLHGGGVSYSKYPAFMDLWAEINAERFDATLNQKVLPCMPDVVEKLRQGSEALDLGCGNGHALILMAKAFPNSMFTGYDLLEGGIAAAGEKAESLGLRNVAVEVKDTADFNEPGKYDLITAFDVIHDIAQPDRTLRSIAASLTPDGAFLMVDLAASSNLHENQEHPLGPWLYTTSCMHCMTVSLACDGPGLGAMWGEQKALRMLDEAGFGNVRIEKIPGDVFNNYYIARK